VCGRGGLWRTIESRQPDNALRRKESIARDVFRQCACVDGTGGGGGARSKCGARRAGGGSDGGISSRTVGEVDLRSL
jgi:hypothetical protein